MKRKIVVRELVTGLPLLPPPPHPLLVPSLTQPLRYHSNQLSRFPLDVLHTFTVILPLITRTMLSVRDKSGKKPCAEVWDIISLFQNNRINSLSLLFLSLQFKFSVHPCKICYVIAFPLHPFAYCLFPVICLKPPITWTPYNSNLFRSTLKAIGSQLYICIFYWASSKQVCKSYQ